MRGDLSEMPAADVCRALAVDGSSGVLEIEGPDGRGTVVFDDGAVIAAGSPTPRARLGDRLVSAGLLEEDALASVLRAQAHTAGQRLGSLLVAEGLVTHDAVRVVAQEQVIDAVFDVVGWSYGAFRFESQADDVPTSEIPVRFAVDELLVEVARRHEEWSDVRQVIPDLDAVPSFRPDARAAQASLEPDEFTLLASIDGERSVRELADDLGYGHFEAARIVYGLTLLGVVEVALPEDEVGRALEDALRAFGPAPEDEPRTGSDAADGPATERAATPPPAPTAADPGELDLAALLAELEAEPMPRPATPAGADPASPHGSGTGQSDEAAAADGQVEDGRLGTGTPEPVAPAAPAGEPPADEPPADEPPAGALPVDRPLTDGADETPAAEVPAEDVPPVRADGREVAELLRELSRMALEDPEGPDGPAEPRAPAAPPPPRRPETSRDEPPRRRRLFGRG
jgi:hypothetical protein